MPLADVVAPGEVLSHTDMCARENKNLQAGMHYRIAPTHSVLLMSTRKGAPYPVLRHYRVTQPPKAQFAAVVEIHNE